MSKFDAERPDKPKVSPDLWDDAQITVSSVIGECLSKGLYIGLFATQDGAIMMSVCQGENKHRFRIDEDNVDSQFVSEFPQAVETKVREWIYDKKDKGPKAKPRAR